MTMENHPELVARLARSNIKTEDFSYLTMVLMEDRTCESRTCENCKYLSQMCGDDFCINNNVRQSYVELDFGCNKWEKKNDEV